MTITYLPEPAEAAFHRHQMAPAESLPAYIERVFQAGTDDDRQRFSEHVYGLLHRNPEPQRFTTAPADLSGMLLAHVCPMCDAAPECYYFAGDEDPELRPGWYVGCARVECAAEGDYNGAGLTLAEAVADWNDSITAPGTIPAYAVAVVGEVGLTILARPGHIAPWNRWYQH